MVNEVLHYVLNYVNVVLYTVSNYHQHQPCVGGHLEVIRRCIDNENTVPKIILSDTVGFLFLFLFFIIINVIAWLYCSHIFVITPEYYQTVSHSFNSIDKNMQLIARQVNV